MIESTPSRPYVCALIASIDYDFKYLEFIVFYSDDILYSVIFPPPFFLSIIASVFRVYFCIFFLYFQSTFVAYFNFFFLFDIFFISIIFQTNYASDLLRVERNMVLRRRRLLSVLKDNEIAPTVTSFPMLGVGDFIDSPLNFSSTDSASIYLPDYIINPHPRYLIFQLISSIFYFFVSLNFSIFQLIISFFHE